MLHAFEGTPLEMDMRSTLDKIAASIFPFGKVSEEEWISTCRFSICQL